MFSFRVDQFWLTLVTSKFVIVVVCLAIISIRSGVLQWIFLSCASVVTVFRTGTLGRTKHYDTRYCMLCFPCWGYNLMNCGTRVNEATDICVALGPAEQLFWRSFTSTFSVRHEAQSRVLVFVFFVCLFFFSLLKLGLPRPREGLHCHTGPHDQHREWFLADGLAGRQSCHCYDHKTQRKKWGMTFNQVLNVIYFLLV